MDATMGIRDAARHRRCQSQRVSQADRPQAEANNRICTENVGNVVTGIRPCTWVSRLDRLLYSQVPPPAVRHSACHSPNHHLEEDQTDIQGKDRATSRPKQKMAGCFGRSLALAYCTAMEPVLVGSQPQRYNRGPI
jgi:hypothetical protein